MLLSWNEIKTWAIAFTNEWKDKVILKFDYMSNV